MATGILINNFRPEYSENILPILDGSLNINSGTNASISYDSSVYFDTGKCIKNTFIVGGDVDRITYNISDYTTTIKNTGSHILSYRFFKPSEDPSITFWVQMFVNGILTINTTIENILETDVFTDRWLCFAQSFDLTSGDVITFKFQAISDVIGSVIYFDALKLEYDDRNLGTPSIYSKPLDGTLISYNYYTGWGNYADNAYTVGSPLTIVSGAAPVSLPNNKANTIETQKPTDITTFYDGTVITGRNGDGINITIDFKCKPTGAGANPKLTLYIDIGGAVGSLYTRDFILSKGSGVEHYYLSSFNAYTLDTWETNGGTVMISAENENIEIYDIRYVITRTHKAR